MLSQSDREAIDRGARDLLEDPGIRLDDELIVDLALSRGGRPGAAPGVVRMPRAMIDECLGLAPTSVRFASRDGVIAVDSASPSRFWTGAALHYLDAHGFRPIGVGELEEFARVAEALPSVDAVVGTSTHETPPPCRDFVGLRVLAGATRKHLRALCFTPRGGEAMIAMAEVLAGGHALKDWPVLSIGFTAHGPLRWTCPRRR